MNRIAFLCIVLGATLWGTISWYVKHLYEFGFTAMEIVTIRVVTSTIILLIFLFIVSPKELKLQSWLDIKYFIGTGIISIIFFNYSLFKAIDLATIPIATALLYTAPAFVTIMSVFLFQEKFSKYKVISLIMTFIGICFIVGFVPFDMANISFISIIFGLGSGIGYALYSIFSKFALKRYSSLTITIYTFLVASIVLIPFFPLEKLALFSETTVLMYGFGLGFLPTALAYIIYTFGLQYMETSNASILTTIEPIVATLIGVFIFREAFSFLQMIGMTCILGAVILIHRSPQKEETIPTPQNQLH